MRLIHGPGPRGVFVFPAITECPRFGGYRKIQVAHSLETQEHCARLGSVPMSACGGHCRGTRADLHGDPRLVLVTRAQAL